MKDQHLIPTQTLCLQYNIEISFVDTLHQMGLLRIEVVAEKHFIHQDQISVLERIIRIHDELHVNLEGIDVVLNLLEKERTLKNELLAVKNRLRLYEGD
jgi:hypothetical protein